MGIRNLRASIRSEEGPFVVVEINTKAITEKVGFEVIEAFNNPVRTIENSGLSNQSKSIAHQVVQKMNDDGIETGAPPLMKIRSKFNISFTKREDQLDYRNGFRSDDIQAYTLAAQIGIHHLQKKSEPLSAQLQQQVLSDLTSAKELTAIARYIIDNPSMGSISGNNDEFKDWLYLNDIVIKSLEEFLNK